jgi:PAS domain S-box-containing protein
MLIRLLQSKHYWLILIIFWLFLTTGSLVWNLALIDRSVKDIAFERGRIMFEMVRLTKLNPVLMANDPLLFKKQSVKDIRYKAVSAEPMNPENLADPWEAQALNKFQNGSSDYIFESFSDEKPGYFRFIGPVFMQEQCLDCHGYEGKKVGSIRGAISVDVFTKPIISAQKKPKQIMVFLHFCGFFIISLTSTILIRLQRKHWLQLKETQQDLKEKEQFLSNVTNSMSEGFVVLDQQGNIEFSNHESEWLIGWHEKEIQGCRFSDLVYAKKDPDAEKNIESIIDQTLKDGITRTGYDCVFKHKEGRYIDVNFSVSPMQCENCMNGVVVSFSDISERKREDEKRRHLERQLNQTHKMEAVGQLAGGIAHEINTPIQYIGDNLRFLKESHEDMNRLLEAYSALTQKASSQTDLKPEIDNINEIIEDIDLDYLVEETSNAIDQSITGASQVADIVLAMKEFAHPGSKEMVLSDLNRIISNAVAVCRNEWKYVAETNLKLSDTLPKIECLAGEISQVVLNIVVNAAHAIEAAKLEKKGVITITSALDDNFAEVRITDTGTGIPEEAQAYVFNPFFTTKEVGRGTGQGLAIALDIVIGKHQGDISFETEVGVGTTFILRLPLNREKAVGAITA